MAVTFTHFFSNFHTPVKDIHTSLKKEPISILSLILELQSYSFQYIQESKRKDTSTWHLYIFILLTSFIC